MLALEEACGAGIAQVMRRLETGAWYVNDVRETIRLGLIGAGMTPEKAMAAVKLHVDGNPSGLAPSVLIAHAVLAAVMVGVPDDPVGKTQAADAETKAAVDPVSSTTTAASAAPASLPSAPDSDGSRETPTTPPSGNWPPASMATTPPTAPTMQSPSP